MTSTNEQDPKLDDRKTRELCGTERSGLRCMRAKGHEHEHEAITPNGPIRWE